MYRPWQGYCSRSSVSSLGSNKIVLFFFCLLTYFAPSSLHFNNTQQNHQRMLDKRIKKRFAKKKRMIKKLTNINFKNMWDGEREWIIKMKTSSSSCHIKRNLFVFWPRIWPPWDTSIIVLFIIVSFFFSKGVSNFWWN